LVSKPRRGGKVPTIPGKVMTIPPSGRRDKRGVGGEGKSEQQTSRLADLEEIDGGRVLFELQSLQTGLYVRNQGHPVC